MSKTYIYPPVSVQTSSAPIEFISNGVSDQVSYDSLVPANNSPLPSGMFILKDGVFLPVTKDTATPANTVSVPVEINGASGPINITAGDLNVQLTDLGANFDRTRIGDGTNQLAINADGSINAGEIAKTVSETLFFDYSASPVDNTAWVQLIAATSDNSKHLTWFESGGYAMEVGFGAIGLETRAFVIPPGGLNGQIDFPIPSGVRVSIKCLEAVTVNVGTIVSNFLK